MSIKGFMFPRTSTGISSLLPNVPWHYSGTLLTLEYRTNPDRVAELLPDGFELADEDPGAVAVIWADWQSCSDNFNELLDPMRAQYKEVFFVVRCKFMGKTYSRCVYIWVDKDYAVMRGQFQGYPKKIGSIHLTRPTTVGKAGPRLEQGGTFGATLAAYDHRLIQAKFTIESESDHAGFVNALPMVHNRWMPSIECDGKDSLDEVVTMTGYDAEIGLTFKGSFEIDFFNSPVEEFQLLSPEELIKGYYRQVGVSWKGGTTLKRSNLT